MVDIDSNPPFRPAVRDMVPSSYAHFFHCHGCRKEVSANRFFSTSGNLCVHCNQCRKQPECRVPFSKLKRYQSKLLEREDRYMKGNFMPPFQPKIRRTAKRKTNGNEKEARRIPRRIATPIESSGSESEEDEALLQESNTEKNPRSQSTLVERIDRPDTIQQGNGYAQQSVTVKHASISTVTARSRKEVAVSTLNNPLPARQNQARADQPLASKVYPWLKRDVINLVETDTLSPMDLIRLRHPESKIVKEISSRQPVRLSAQGHFVSQIDTSFQEKEATFVEALPDVRAFAQVWMTYIDIRSLHNVDHSSISAYTSFLARILDLDTIYDWEEGLCKYVFSVCRHRFGAASPEEWRTDDLARSNDYLRPHARRERSR